jgi:ABC-type uncharacterized transport system auxiliary subunit
MSRTLLLLAALAAALACRPIPATHYYVLAPPAERAGTGGERPDGEQPDGVRLGVETFAVDPPYDQDRLVWRVGRDASEVGFYGHHRWAASPGRLVATALAAGLAGTPGLAAVEPVTVGGRYSAVLAGRVVALEEVDLPERQLARIQVDLKLFDAAGALVWSRLVTAEAGGRAEAPSDVMRQMQSAFEKLLAEVRGELAAVLAGSDSVDRD